MTKIENLFTLAIEDMKERANLQQKINKTYYEVIASTKKTVSKR